MSGVDSSAHSINEEGFRGYLRTVMPRGTARTHHDSRFASKRRYGAGMRENGDAADTYFRRFRHSRLFFIAALETGLRRGDLIGLRCRNVKLADGWISVVQGKTGREVVIHISSACRIAIEEALSDRSPYRYRRLRLRDGFGSAVRRIDHSAPFQDREAARGHHAAASVP
jgi:integrase